LLKGIRGDFRHSHRYSSSTTSWFEVDIESVALCGHCGISIQYRWLEELRATCSIAHAAMRKDMDIKTIPNRIISATRHGLMVRQ